MKSYSTLRTLFGTLSLNAAANNLTLGDELMNDAYHRICGMSDFPFLQTTKTISTVQGQQGYQLPNDCDMVINVTVTIGTTKYVPIEAPNRGFWDQLNQQTTFQSNFPTYFYIYGGRLYFYPIPSSSTADAITINYRKRVVNLSQADYTTGTASATAASASIVGVGTSWTSAMAGRWIRLTTGDYQWYQIASVESGTTATLTAPYLGTTVTGSAFIIGEMSLLPEAFQDLPLWEALYTYFSSVNPDAERSSLFKGKYNELLTLLKRDYGTKTTDPSLHDNSQRPLMNPNLFITLS